MNINHMEIVSQETTASNNKLPQFIVDPEFRDKLPKLSEVEYNTLRENILEDGRVKRPLTCWHGSLEKEDESGNIDHTERDYLIDGHNRWAIIQDHPELPYTVEFKEFSNKWGAIAWMYKNQRGQRNLSDEWQARINSKIVEAELKAVGEHTGNQYTRRMELDTSGPIPKSQPKSTVARVAQEIGVPEGTLKKQLEYGRGLDAGEEVHPGFEQAVLDGRVKASKSDIRSLRLIEPDERKHAVDAIIHPEKREPKPKKPNCELEPQQELDEPVEQPTQSEYSKTRELMANIREVGKRIGSGDVPPYTTKDLIGELCVMRDEFIGKVKRTLSVRKSVIGSGERVVEVLESCERKLSEIETSVMKGAKKSK